MRDPRKDPRIGDVLRKKYQGQYFESRGYNEREVFDVLETSDGTKVVYVAPGVCTPEVRLSSWRKWAKRATVIKTGGDGTCPT